MEIKEPAISYSKRKYTIEEYLEMENASDEKHEYYQGEIFAMSGAKFAHNFICANVLYGLSKRLENSPCNPLGSDTKVHVPENSLFTYPDISVHCGEAESYNNDECNLPNPVIIFEVLSPSTRKYDRGAKFELYKAIPSLREYVLIDSVRIFIEAWQLPEQNSWQKTVYNQTGAALILHSLYMALPLTEIYKNTKLLKE